MSRVEGSAGLSMTSSGEGGPLRLTSDEDMKWESLQAASGPLPASPAPTCARCVTSRSRSTRGPSPARAAASPAPRSPPPSRSPARNIPVGDGRPEPPTPNTTSTRSRTCRPRSGCGSSTTTTAASRSQARRTRSTWRPACGATSSSTISSGRGLGGSGNYHADSSHVGWPDIFRTILHTHDALSTRRSTWTAAGSCGPDPRPQRGPFGAQGGTRLFASGGLRGELDMLKVLIGGPTGCSRGASARRSPSAARNAATATWTAPGAASRPSRS